MTHTPETVLVTGGGGFLGGHIVSQLLARGDTVRTISRGDYPHLRDKGVEHIRANLADAGATADACKGVDAVIHVAAKAGVWGPLREYRTANVTATENVIAACRAAGVTRLVHTSSPSVVFNARNQVDADESLPYTKRFYSHYSRTKAEAEQRVLGANGPDLQTVALRPHLIMGPGDPHLMTRLIERAKAGKLVRVGGGRNEVGMTWVGDAARAHLLALDRLRADKADAACAGKAYFITQGEGVPLWPWIQNVLGRLDLPPVRKKVPLRMAWGMGLMMEWVWWLLRLGGEPPLTRFVAGQLGTDHHYRIAAATRDLGYTPSIGVPEMTDRVIESFESPTA